MRVFLALLVCVCSLPLIGQAPLVCNDTLFYRFNTNKPLPKFACDTMYLISQGHYQKLFVEKHQDKAIRESLNREIQLYQDQQKNLSDMADRHKQYADSLQVFITEKNMQLDSMTVLANRATQNTDKALKVAKTNRAMSIGSSILSAILLVLVLVK